jgi:DNA topoisomerase-3
MGRILIALIQDPLLKSPEMTGEWEEKLKLIERKELDDQQFMDGIGDYIRSVIESGRTGQFDPEKIGSCPRCGKEVIRGKSAYGCSGWKEGCKFVLKPDYKDLSLSANQVQVLLQMRFLPYPIHIAGEPRILILSTQGDLMDLRLPSADRQKSETKSVRPAKG